MFLCSLLLGSLLWGTSRQRKSIGVYVLQLQLRLQRIGAQFSRTTRLFRRKPRTGDSYFQNSIGCNLEENIIQVWIPSPREIPHYPYRLLELQELPHSYFQRISMLHLRFSTSLLENLVLLHTMLVYSYLENSGYHRLHNTLYSVKKVSLPSVVLVANLSLLGFLKVVVVSLQWVDLQSPVPRHTYKEITPILVVLLVRSSVLTLIIRLRLLLEQEEKKVRHMQELLILQRMRLVEILMFVVVLLRSPILTPTMSLPSSMVKKMRTGVFSIPMLVTDLVLMNLVLLLVLRHLTMRVIPTTKISHSLMEV